eukprot:PhF_6_TR10050/c0_g1_i1/m.15486
MLPTCSLPPIRDYYPSCSLYETKYKFFLVAANPTKTRYKVMKIDKNPTTIQCSTDGVEYTGKQLENLLNDLADTHVGHGGLAHTGTYCGLIGAIRFTKCYYLIFATQSKVVGKIGPHIVSEVADVKLVPMFVDSQSGADVFLHSLQKDDEARYRRIFGDMDLKRDFYYCHTYDLSNTLQQNMLCHTSPTNDMFVANHRLLLPFQGVDSTFFLSLVQGSFSMGQLNVFHGRVCMILMSRRSRHYAGTRFMKRGMNEAGFVANHLEIEQIVYDMTSLSQGETVGNFTSYVQMRGSVPAFWTQQMDHKKPKPAVRIGRYDMNALSAKRHFAQVLARYGSPIFVLDLLQQKEKKKRECLLSELFDGAILDLKHTLPLNAEIHYLQWDLRGASRIHREKVVNDMAAIAEDTLVRTNFFHCDSSKKYVQLQNGVVRSNCLDCLDRTNLAQLFINKNVLGCQLAAIGVLPKASDLFHYSTVVDTLLAMHLRMGDAIALQYTGSRAVSNGVLKRKMFEDLFINMKRFYSNHMTDSEKQKSIDLFLGVYSCYNAPWEADLCWNVPPHPDAMDRAITREQTNSPSQERPSTSTDETATQSPAEEREEGAPEVQHHDCRRLDLWDIEGDYYLHMNVANVTPSLPHLDDDDTWSTDALKAFRKSIPTLVSLPPPPNPLTKLCNVCASFRGMRMTASFDHNPIVPKTSTKSTPSVDNVSYFNHVLYTTGGMLNDAPLNSYQSLMPSIPVDEFDKKFFPSINENVEQSAEYFESVTPLQKDIQDRMWGRAGDLPSIFPTPFAPLNLTSSDVCPTLTVPVDNLSIYKSYANFSKISSGTRQDLSVEIKSSEHFSTLRSLRQQHFDVRDIPAMESFILAGVDRVNEWNVDETARILSSLNVSLSSVQRLKAKNVRGSDLEKMDDIQLSASGVKDPQDRKQIREIIKRKNYMEGLSAKDIEVASQAEQTMLAATTSSTENSPHFAAFSNLFAKHVPDNKVEHTMEAILKMMMCSRCGVPVADRARKTHCPSAQDISSGTTTLGELPELVGGEVIPDTMLGSQLVTWVVENASKLGLRMASLQLEIARRRAACEFLNALLRGGVLCQVSPALFIGESSFVRMNTMEDSRYVLYRFTASEKMHVLNMLTMNNGTGSHLHTPLQLGELLLSVALEILRMYGTIDVEDKSAVQRVLLHPTYVILQDNVAELQFVDLSVMNDVERMAFFINIYNVLYIHALVGVTTQYDLSYNLFLEKCAYIIGGNVLSLLHIKHGILRGNRLFGDRLCHPFPPNDARLKLVIPKMDYRIHFALVDMYLGGMSEGHSVSQNRDSMHLLMSDFVMVDMPQPNSTEKTEGNPSVLESNKPPQAQQPKKDIKQSQDQGEASSEDDDEGNQAQRLVLPTTDAGHTEDDYAWGIFKGFGAPAPKKAPRVEHLCKIILPDQVKAQLHEITTKYLQRIIGLDPGTAHTVVLPSAFVDFPDDFGVRKEDWIKVSSKYVSKSDLRRITKAHQTNIRFSKDIV